VTTIADSGAGSLRQTVSDCSGHTITFDPSLNGKTITLLSQIAVAANTTIQGPGASLLTISGGDAKQIFSTSGANVTVSGLTFAHGYGPPGSSGGAIYNSGASSTLTVTNCVFVSNWAPMGGAIANNSGVLTIANSTFVSNSANAGGGGVYNVWAGTVTITNSTFVSNSSWDGGAVCNYVNSTMTIANSTFASNDAWQGGAIFSGGTMITIASSTFSGNTKSLRCDSGTCRIGSNIIDTLWVGTFTSLGYNLIGVNNTTFSPTTGDQIGVAPPVGPLGNYGGPTKTMMLTLPLASNPAWAAIPPASCTVTTDQRGEPRPSPLNANGYCDIGAVERGSGDSSIPGAPGMLCIVDDDCNAGVCLEGRCCGVTCDISNPICGATACDVNGECVYPATGTTCGGTAPCNAVCNGSGKCGAYPSGNSCSLGGTSCRDKCNGAGTCVSGGLTCWHCFAVEGLAIDWGWGACCNGHGGCGCFAICDGCPGYGYGGSFAGACGLAMAAADAGCSDPDGTQCGFPDIPCFCWNSCNTSGSCP
jgi:hypothetical protein